METKELLPLLPLPMSRFPKREQKHSKSTTDKFQMTVLSSDSKRPSPEKAVKGPPPNQRTTTQTPGITYFVLFFVFSSGNSARRVIFIYFVFVAWQFHSYDFSVGNLIPSRLDQWSSLGINTKVLTSIGFTQTCLLDSPGFWSTLAMISPKVRCSYS